ncbi:MAG TPA: hypothetical protein VEH04_08130 [Verrucomicrobiae bacterium]|nr:hypothetical protein [Verrucomicrobiae bacterium]
MDSQTPGFFPMRSFILIGRSRKTGKDELICGRDVKPTVQIDKFKTLARSRTNNEFESVSLLEEVPAKKTLRFITVAQAEARVKSAEEAEAKAKADAEAQAKEAKEKQSQPENSGPETPNKKKGKK